MVTSMLIGYAIIHPAGNSVSRAIKHLPADELVTFETILRWEHQLAQEYADLRDPVTIRVFSFQPIGRLSDQTDHRRHQTGYQTG
jgi:hypothetical protein